MPGSLTTETTLEVELSVPTTEVDMDARFPEYREGRIGYAPPDGRDVDMEK